MGCAVLLRAARVGRKQGRTCSETREFAREREFAAVARPVAARSHCAIDRGARVWRLSLLDLGRIQTLPALDPKRSRGRLHRGRPDCERQRRERATLSRWWRLSITCRSSRGRRCWLLPISNAAHPCGLRIPRSFRIDDGVRRGARCWMRREHFGAETALEARALGVNWVFAPDADVNNNPDNPIINTRSFGADPQSRSGECGGIYRRRACGSEALCSGRAEALSGAWRYQQDSHLQLARLDQPKERLESLELAPFRAAIAHRRGFDHDSASRCTRI